MKYTLCFCLVISVLFSGYAQKKKKTPPNTIALSEQIYIDKSPVTNLMYLEFLETVGRYWNIKLHDTINKILPHKISEKLRSKNIDEQESKSLNALIQLPAYKDVEKYLGSNAYLRHPNNSQFPVLYVNKKQAELYCLWRTDMVNLMRNQKARDPLKAQYVTYRLPTHEELKLAVDFFEQNQKLKQAKATTPTQMNARRDQFTIFKLAEFTSSDQAFEYAPNWQESSSDNNTANNYTTFRCICETGIRQVD